MTEPNGYSLDQLLAWCCEDRLIQGYEKKEEQIVIYLDGHGHVLPRDGAKKFLTGIFGRNTILPDATRFMTVRHEA